MSSLFENAHFGKVYLTRDGRKAIYHKREDYPFSDGKTWVCHSLMIEPKNYKTKKGDIPYSPYTSYVEIGGIGVLTHFKNYNPIERDEDIVAEYKIDEKELDDLAWANADTFEIGRPITIDHVVRAYKSGYRKALSDD